MRKYIGGAAQKQTKALDLSFSMHPHGNPVIPMSVPVPVIVEVPTDVDYGEQVWTMPSGRAAYRAALAIDAGVDVEAKLAELGGVRK